MLYSPPFAPSYKRESISKVYYGYHALLVLKGELFQIKDQMFELYPIFTTAKTKSAKNISPDKILVIISGFDFVRGQVSFENLLSMFDLFIAYLCETVK